MSLERFRMSTLRDKQEAEALERAIEKVGKETKQTKVETKKETPRKKKK